MRERGFDIPPFPTVSNSQSTRACWRWSTTTKRVTEDLLFAADQYYGSPRPSLQTIIYTKSTSPCILSIYTAEYHLHCRLLVLSITQKDQQKIGIIPRTSCIHNHRWYSYRSSNSCIRSLPWCSRGELVERFKIKVRRERERETYGVLGRLADWRVICL